MKTSLLLAVMVSAFGLQPSALVRAGTTTIDAANRFSYGANFGWMDWVADTNNGAIIGEYVCSGFIYAANVGWINLGSGSPANGIYYQNNSASDFGVNQDGLGNLRGFAWGANIGWINFETNGAPKVDLLTGNLSGYVWSANCGWISLSNSVAYVQADAIQQGALAADGLPVSWLLANFGTTNVDANADPDHDGMSNMQEYLAGTNPNDAGSVLEIISLARGASAGANTSLQWASEPTRFYAVQSRPSLASGSWADLVALPSAGAGSASFADPNPTNDFFRIRAYRPLTP
jgi:hypothetical protein